MYKAKLHIVELESGDFHTIVNGSIAGHKARFVLDTGASRSCVDKDYAQAILPDLYSEKHDGVTAGIGGDDFDVRIADLPDFKLGRFHLTHYVRVALLDFSYINQAYHTLHKAPIQMILGNDFFVEHQAVIDYKQGYLFFEK